MRGGAKEHEMQTDKKNSIPITVRQLEAIIRMSESLAKMQLLPFATEVHVEEALRLFQVSTLDAAMSGSLSGTNIIIIFNKMLISDDNFPSFERERKTKAVNKRSKIFFF